MVETHPEKRLIGYARVSTYGQTLDSQLEQLRAAGCSSRNIYREKVTGARADRRELNRMLGKLAPGQRERDLLPRIDDRERNEKIVRFDIALQIGITDQDDRSVARIDNDGAE